MHQSIEFEQIDSKTETEWGLHVVLKSGCVIDDSNVVQIMQHIAASGNETGKKGILIDASNIKRSVSLLKFMEVGELMQKLRRTYLRIAFIAPHLAHDDNSKFMETVGYNRGVSIQYFTDTDEAIKWLMN